MTGTITISLAEYEKLKALEGKKLYSGSLSQDEIDRVAKIESECIGVKTLTSYSYLGTFQEISIVPKDEYLTELLGEIQAIRKENTRLSDERIELIESISNLKVRNLWERITRKYE